MYDFRYPVKIVKGMPVITPPAQIDRTTAYRLRLALLHAAARGHTTIVVDMTRTQFCDSAALTVLTQAHKRAVAEGGELRLVILADGAVSRIFTLTGLDGLIPHFRSLSEALRQRPAAVILPLKPHPAPESPRFPGRASGSDAGA